MRDIVLSLYVLMFMQAMDGRTEHTSQRDVTIEQVQNIINNLPVQTAPSPPSTRLLLPLLLLLGVPLLLALSAACKGLALKKSCDGATLRLTEGKICRTMSHHINTLRDMT